MGAPTESLEPEEIERRFGWVETFDGDGTDDSILRDLLAEAIVASGGYATADDWAAAWLNERALIFGEKVTKFFPSVLHAADKLSRGYQPRSVSVGTMPSSTSAMAISPVGIVNAGHPRAAAAQAIEIASLLHVGDVGFCQDGAAAVAAAVAASLSPGATVDGVLQAASDNIKPWSGAEMRTLVSEALALARDTQDFKAFRASYHRSFRRAIACDSRETVPAALAVVWLAAGDPWQAAVLGANFGRDSDTIACMAAGICGALSGVSPANEAKLRLLPAQTLSFQETLAGKLAEVRRAKVAVETDALSNCV
ncbi:MAG: ADP-ribosylglycohydrolase family protein [Alphaproteobacteria bacterium]|nr:ADP-ribosylglycohydrolase family protein [Alphaproteobacteria bacterium]